MHCLKHIGGLGGGSNVSRHRTPCKAEAIEDGDRNVVQNRKFGVEWTILEIMLGTTGIADVPQRSPGGESTNGNGIEVGFSDCRP